MTKKPKKPKSDQSVRKPPLLQSMLRRGGSLKFLAENLMEHFGVKDPRKARISVTFED